VKYFTGIIKEENRRMNAQVEYVLQMSLIDKRDFDLRVMELDIHEIINRAARNFRLQVERKEGEVVLDLKAENPVIQTDENHFYNVITNLLDNACKYSPEKPYIRVSTENTAAGIKISVEDHGIGITKEAQHKIFDKFFRVSTGNIHNVKGFGLGLSYVKAIVLAFGGKILLESEPGKGSRFDIFLPFKNPA
jgi:signal transduction histidine kinase